MDNNKGLTRQVAPAIQDQIKSDLGLSTPFIKGQKITVRNCWHFSTDGSAVDSMFYDDQDFIDAMNRIFIVLRKHNVTILAFVLMDTHVHFILHGRYDECLLFVNDFVSRTSRHISIRHKDRNKLKGIPISHQSIDDDRYLKTAICYVIKNPPVAGLPFMAWNYPWSSGPLYFQRGKHWTADTRSSGALDGILGTRNWRNQLKTKTRSDTNISMHDGMVLPQEFVAVDLVESIFKTTRSFNYFMCISKEEDIESQSSIISHLSIPIQEMRQHRTELCRQMFGVETIKSLTAQQRIRLARALRGRYNSSIKQITRLCGLRYDESLSLIE